MRASVSSITLVVLFAGCALTREPGPACVLRDPQVEESARGPGGKVDYARAFQVDMQRAVEDKKRRLDDERARGATPRAAGDLHMQLVLSAGGQYGAYGAGFLRAWLDSGRAPTCGDFDFVTGISTGSMMSTHVFLATAAKQQCADDPDLRAIEKLYRGLTEERVLRRRSKLEMLFSDSLYDTAPLRALVEELLTDDMLLRVAQEWERGRRLYVGAVNADSGQFEYFDLTFMAKHLAGAQRKDCYEAAILASAAIPIGFEPVFINGQMYIDGGARMHTFFMDQTRKALAFPGAGLAHKHIYGILNTDLYVAENSVDRGVLPIAQRTGQIAVDQLMIDSAFYVSQRGQADGFEVRWTSAANSRCSKLAGDKLFDPALETCLADDGVAEACKPSPWALFDDIRARQPNAQGRSPGCAR